MLFSYFYGSSSTSGLSNYLNNTPGSTYEAIVAPGDSGGGVFDSSGVLLGINNYLGTFAGQPANAAIFGNVSEMADISVYRSQILSVVPEPSAQVMAGMLLGALGIRRRATTRRA